MQPGALKYITRSPHIVGLRVLVGKANLARFCFPFFLLSSLSFSSLCSAVSSPPLPLFLRLLLLLLSKTIKVKIIDDEEYEKNKTFYIEIGEPRLVESNNTKGQEGAEPP